MTPDETWPRSKPCLKKEIFLSKKGRGIQGLGGLLSSFLIKGILRGVLDIHSTFGGAILEAQDQRGVARFKRFIHTFFLIIFYSFNYVYDFCHNYAWLNSF